MGRTNPRRIACEWWRWEGIAPKLGFREGIEPFVELDAQLMVAIKSGTVAYSFALRGELYARNSCIAASVV
jgi:hypothetical protein